MTKIDRGPEPASETPWRHERTVDCDGSPWTTIYDADGNVVARDVGALGAAIAHRFSTYNAICDRAEAAEARVVELERELVRQGGVLRDAVSIAEEKDALSARYREALEGMAGRVRGIGGMAGDYADVFADAIAAHVSEVLK